MKIFLDIMFYIGGLGTVCRYIGWEFFKEHSTWFLILFIGGGLGRLVLSTREQKHSEE